MQPITEHRTRTAATGVAAAVAVVAVGLAIAAPLVLRSSSRIDSSAPGGTGPEQAVPAPAAEGGGESGTVEIPLGGPGGSGAVPGDPAPATLPGGAPLPEPGPLVDEAQLTRPDDTTAGGLPPAGPVDPSIPADLGFTFPGSTLAMVIDDSARDGRARSWQFQLDAPGSCESLESGLAASGVVIGKVTCFSDTASVDGLHAGVFLRADLLDSTLVQVTLWI